jgi:segregation and condensation protein B
MELDARIEAILFYKTEPLTYDGLASMLGADSDALAEGITALEMRLRGGGTRIICTDTTVQLVTAPEYAELIETMRKEEVKGDIGKAGAETLAIILYRGPLSRAEVDRIRGVNSTFIIRNLLVRGLIERRDADGNARSFLYAPTPELYAQLGITKREKLPDFSEVLNALDTFEHEETEREKDSAPLT